MYLPGADVDWAIEANFTDNVDYVGQAGGFASRGYAQLGRRTAFVGYVGDDWGGRFVRAELARDGVDTSALLRDPAGTSRSVNIMYRDGRRKNFYDGKGHMGLEPDLALCARILMGARLAHFNIPNWARQLLPLARDLGVRIAVDLQDVVSLDDPYRQDFLQYADIVFLSAANHAEPRPLIETLLAERPERVVIAGMGARGCAAGDRSGIHDFAPVELDLPVVDTNGAGDGLAVGFLSSFVLDGLDLATAVRRGQIVARYTCAQRASTSHLITAAQLAAFEHTLALL